MELSNELKKKLGFIIEYERHIRYSDNKLIWNYKAFLQKGEDLICDLKTYRKLRIGKVIRNDQVYFDLMNVFDFKIEYDKQINIKLKNIMNEMEYDFNRLDMKRFKRNYKFIQDLLLPYANTQPYQLIYDAITSFAKCVLYEEQMPKEAFYRYLSLLPVFDEPLQDLIKYLLSESMIQSGELNHDVIKKLYLRKSYKSYLIHQDMLFLLIKRKYFDTIEPLTQLSEKLLKEKNYNRLIYVKILLLFSMIHCSQIQSIQIEADLKERKRQIQYIY